MVCEDDDDCMPDETCMDGICLGICQDDDDCADDDSGGCAVSGASQPTSLLALALLMSLLFLARRREQT